MQSNQPTMVPPSTETLAVEQQGVGVRLVVEPTSPSDGADPATWLLLETYSPVFVAFPEVPPAGPESYVSPHSESATHDYHPRDVELFLGSPPARTLNATPTNLLSLAGRLLGAYALIMGPAVVLLLVAEVATGALAISIFISAVAALVEDAWSRFRSGPAPGPVERRDRTAWSSNRLAITRLFPPKPDPRIAAWNGYRDQLASGTAGSRTSYVRVHATDDDELYLQYWQFYVFNDWDNWHEADWEVVMVRLGRDGAGGREPLGAVYSSHLGGLWRDWADVKLARGDGQFADADDAEATHPVVWVALGSHAQYFESLDGHYKARLTQRWGFAQYGGWLSLSSDASDRVAATVSLDEPQRYVLKAFRDDAWWLEFGGFWGAHEGIPGPAMQGLKWHDPAKWVEQQCVGDPGVWSEALHA